MTETATAPARPADGPAGLRALKPRHKLIALMAASGRSNAQIAAELGMSSVGIHTILKSPLMRALVAQYLQQIESKTLTNVADVIATLRGETAKTLKTIVEIRDTGVKEDSVRLAAAIELLDRQIPKVHKTDESRTVRIVLDGARLDRLRTITAEARTLPMTTTAATATTAQFTTTTSSGDAVRSLDDVIARYAAAEAAQESTDG